MARPLQLRWLAAPGKPIWILGGKPPTGSAKRGAMPAQDSSLLALFGDAYVRVWQDREAQDQLLRSSDPLDRLLALCLLRDDNHSSAAAREVVEQIAFGGRAGCLADEREIAWLVLSRVYGDTHDGRVTAAAAQVVLDPAAHDAVRLSAYRALLYVTDRAVESSEPVSSLTFPGDVDWELVGQYAR